MEPRHTSSCFKSPLLQLLKTPDSCVESVVTEVTWRKAWTQWVHTSCFGQPLSSLQWVEARDLPPWDVEGGTAAFADFL